MINAPWPIMRLKFVAKLNPGATTAWPHDPEAPVTFLPMESISPRGGVDAPLKRPLREVRTGYTYFERSDVVIAKITPCFENGKGAWLKGLETEFGFGTTELIVLRPTARIDGRFLYWVTQGRDFRSGGERSMTGSAGQQRVSNEFVANFPIAVPPISVQQDVCDALELRLADIDRFIAAKSRMVHLFEEQKHTMINQAVLRGVHPDAPLKASGLEWLGDIPRHWTVRPNVRLFRERLEKGRGDLPVLMVSLHTGVTVGEDLDEDGRPRRLIEDKGTYKFAAKGDIAYNMMRMWQGAVGVVPVDGLVSPAYVVASPLDSESRTGYFTLLFRTESYKNEINRNSRGIVSDRNRLYWDDFKQLSSPVPPPTEQQDILNALALETARLNDAIQTAEREIRLIEEFRTALIADVVRGTLDIEACAAKVEGYTA